MKNSILNIKQKLANIYSPNEIQAIIYLIFEHVKSFSKTDILINSHAKLNEIEKNQINDMIVRLQNHEPIQYIIGKTEFYGFPFKVNADVLIPRPETEELVQKILLLADRKKHLKILDIGTGSGCIAVSLAKKLTNAKIFASDISLASLEIAKQNAKLNEVSVQFIHDDILNSQIREKFDIIVSNPPYIVPRQKRNMEQNVLNHEPHLALFVTEEDPLIYHRKIAKLANIHLRKNGICMLEINEILGKQTLTEMEKYLNKKGEIILDINDKDRFVLFR